LSPVLEQFKIILGEGGYTINHYLSYNISREIYVPPVMLGRHGFVENIQLPCGVSMASTVEPTTQQRVRIHN
jgi:hypothetical protein